MQTDARLIIICGLPGSGKTTLARELELALPALRMSADDWMLELAINLHDEAARAKIEALQWRFTKKLLASGNKVIIEWGSWGRWERDRHRTEARSLGASVELHYLFAPLEELFRRIQQRNMETPPIRWEDVQAWGGIFQPPTIEEIALFDAPLLHGIYEQEESLKGGNTAEFVVRLGATVRKPATPSTPAVQSFVKHLRSVGFRDAPEPLGMDVQGRQVWEFIPGLVWHSTNAHTQADLRRVGTMIRDLHRAAASFCMPEGIQWNRRYEFSGHDLICHNDLAPWNLVCG